MVAVALIVDLRLQRMPEFSYFAKIDLKESHRGFPPIQPSNMWFNATIPIKNGTRAIQVTAYNENDRAPTEAFSSRIAFVKQTERTLTFGLEYWSDPFTIFLLNK